MVRAHCRAILNKKAAPDCFRRGIFRSQAALLSVVGVSSSIVAAAVLEIGM
jgi:hypothetical protein